MLAKTNYRIHTDSIKQNIVPKITENQKKYIYAEEADVLNVALFGMMDLCQVFRHSFSRFFYLSVFKFIPIPLLVMGPQSSFIT